MKEAIKERDLQIEAMIVKMDLMKRGLDEITLRHFDSQKLLEQMGSQDFAKQNLILKR